MQSVRRTTAAASVLLLAIALVRCVLITGTGDPDTSRAPAGCTGSSDCEAGDRCCVSASLTTVCSSQCAAIVGATLDGGATESIQICKTNGECEGGLCLSQQCTLGSTSIAIQSCSAIAECIAK
jgi:hypothetical protein